MLCDMTGRLWRFATTVGVALCVLLHPLMMPAIALADRCGGPASVTPERGPPGTRFVFETNVGAPSDLRLFRDGTVVASVALEGSGLVRYSFVPTAADIGHWYAQAVVRSNPACFGEAEFDVDPAQPEIGKDPRNGASLAYLAFALLVALMVIGLVVLGWRRVRRT